MCVSMCNIFKKERKNGMHRLRWDCCFWFWLVFKHHTLTTMYTFLNVNTRIQNFLSSISRLIKNLTAQVIMLCQICISSHIHKNGNKLSKLKHSDIYCTLLPQKWKLELGPISEVAAFLLLLSECIHFQNKLFQIKWAARFLGTGRVTGQLCLPLWLHHFCA